MSLRKSSDHTGLADSLRLSSAALLAAAAGLVVYLVIARTEFLPVLFPLFVAGALAFAFLRALWRRRQGTVPVFEIGAVYAAAVLTYTVYPLIAFLANSGRYGPFQDNRLFVARPSAAEMAPIAWFYLIHLIAFMTLYLLARGRRVDAGLVVPSVRTHVFWQSLFLYGAIAAFFLVLARKFDLSAGSYEEGYLVYSRLPLLLAQVSAHLAGLRVTAELVVLAFLFTRYKRFRPVIIGWLALLLLSTVARLGSRTELVVVLIASVMLFHLWVRPIKTWEVAAAGAFGLAAFLTLGVLRSYRIALSEGSAFDLFSFNSEFETLFGNAFDIAGRKRSGEIGALPVTFLFSDFLALIPQQLLPFSKISPSVWYVNTFYPALAEQGGGLAFGTVSESLVGLGWIDLALRGGALGILCGRLYNFYAARRRSFWAVVGYVWATISVYQSFRNTTFYLFTLFFYRFAPVFLFIESPRILASSRQRREYAVSAERAR